MTVTTIGATQVHVDPEGFLTEYGEWSEDLARQLAGLIGLELTEAHLAVLRSLREDYQERGESATLRHAAAVSGVPIKELFALFPGKPAKKMAYVAGLPKPVGCV